MLRTTRYELTERAVPSIIFRLTANDDLASSAILANLSAFSAALGFIFNPVLGGLSDRFGRKPVLVTGAGLSAIGMLCSGLAVDVPSLICARLVAGAGASCYLGGVQVYLTDIAPPRTQARVLGANHAALLLGVSFGPVRVRG